MEVRGQPPSPRVTDPDFRLHRPRPVDDPNPSLGRGGSIVGEATDGTDIARTPVRELVRGERNDVDTREIPTDDERHLPRIEAPIQLCPNDVRIKPLDRGPGSCRGPSIRRAVRVDGSDEGLLRAATGICPGLEKVVQAFRTEPVHLIGGKGRHRGDLGHEVEGSGEVLRGHVDGDRGCVPAGLGVERGSNPLARLDEIHRRVALRPLGECPGHEDRRPGEVVRFVGRPARDDQRGIDEGPPGQVGGNDAEAVVQPGPVERGERIRPGRARLRSLGDDDASAGAHAATSESPGTCAAGR